MKLNQKVSPNIINEDDPIASLQYAVSLPADASLIKEANGILNDAAVRYAPENASEMYKATKLVRFSMPDQTIMDIPSFGNDSYKVAGGKYDFGNNFPLYDFYELNKINESYDSDYLTMLKSPEKNNMLSCAGDIQYPSLPFMEILPGSDSYSKYLQDNCEKSMQDNNISDENISNILKKSFQINEKNPYALNFFRKNTMAFGSAISISYPPALRTKDNGVNLKYNGITISFYFRYHDNFCQYNSNKSFFNEFEERKDYYSINSVTENTIYYPELSLPIFSICYYDNSLDKKRKVINIYYNITRKILSVDSQNKTIIEGAKSTSITLEPDKWYGFVCSLSLIKDSEIGQSSNGDFYVPSFFSYWLIDPDTDRIVGVTDNPDTNNPASGVVYLNIKAARNDKMTSTGVDTISPVKYTIMGCGIEDDAKSFVLNKAFNIGYFNSTLQEEKNKGNNISYLENSVVFDGTTIFRTDNDGKNRVCLRYGISDIAGIRCYPGVSVPNNVLNSVIIKILHNLPMSSNIPAYPTFLNDQTDAYTIPVTDTNINGNIESTGKQTHGSPDIIFYGKYDKYGSGNGNCSIKNILTTCVNDVDNIDSESSKSFSSYSDNGSIELRQAFPTKLVRGLFKIEKVYGTMTSKFSSGYRYSKKEMLENSTGILNNWVNNLQLGRNKDIPINAKYSGNNINFINYAGTRVWSKPYQIIFKSSGTDSLRTNRYYKIIYRANDILIGKGIGFTYTGLNLDSSGNPLVYGIASPGDAFLLYDYGPMSNLPLYDLPNKLPEDYDHYTVLLSTLYIALDGSVIINGSKNTSAISNTGLIPRITWPIDWSVEQTDSDGNISPATNLCSDYNKTSLIESSGCNSVTTKSTSTQCVQITTKSIGTMCTSSTTKQGIEYCNTNCRMSPNSTIAGCGSDSSRGETA